MKPSTLHFLLLTIAGWMNRRQAEAIEYLLEENRVLREHLGKRRLPFTDAQRRRLAEKGKRLRQLASIVTPETILRWYRRLVAKKYDGSARRRPGRPPVAREVRDLVLRVARENPSWGYTRIVGALTNLGRSVSRSTVKRILAADGILPAPERGQRTQWRTFLRSHWDAIAAADFFTVEVLSLSLRPGPLPRLLRHRALDAAGPSRGHRSPAHRRLDEAGRSQPHRRARWLPHRQAVSDRRPRSAVHRRVSATAL